MWNFYSTSQTPQSTHSIRRCSKIAEKNILSCQRKVQSQWSPRSDPIAQTSNLELETFKMPCWFHPRECTCVCLSVCMCARQTSDVASVNNFPVCGLFTLLLSVSTEAIVCGFGVEAQDLPLLVDPEREGRHRRPDEDSAIIISIRTTTSLDTGSTLYQIKFYVTPD